LANALEDGEEKLVAASMELEVMRGVGFHRP
jgi:hypothetical protein